MRIRVIDFETTGEPPEADVVEAAYVDVVHDTQHPMGVAGNGDLVFPWIIEAPGWTTLVRPTRPIEVEARAAHHLSEEEVEGGIPQDQWLTALMNEGGPSDFLAAHNAAFEKQFFPEHLRDSGKWICTDKAALRLWPDAPKHTNSVLRYWLEGCDPGEAGLPPHRALPDCRVTALILVRALQEASVEQLVAWEAEPRWQPVIGFGKHRGKKWTEVPLDYIQWVLRSDFDDDTKWNAEQGRKR